MKAALIVYHLDSEIDLDRASFTTGARGEVTLVDGRGYRLDLTEPIRPVEP